MLKKLWNIWLDGGLIRGRKRYVIIPIIFAIFLPLSMWLSDNEGMSYLDYIQMPKWIIFAVFCLVGGSTLLYLLDTYGVNQCASREWHNIFDFSNVCRDSTYSYK